MKKFVNLGSMDVTTVEKVLIIGASSFVVGAILFVFVRVLHKTCCITTSRKRSYKSEDVELGVMKPVSNEVSNAKESVVEEYSELESDEEEESIRVTRPVVFQGKLYNQDYQQIYTRLLESGDLFTDDEFPPDEFSISYDGKGENSEVKCWVRAKDLFLEPAMVKKGHGKSDVNQGMLGDCWLLSAMASLSEKDRLFQVNIIVTIQVQSPKLKGLGVTLFCCCTTHPPTTTHTNFSQHPDIQLSSIFHSRLT